LASFCRSVHLNPMLSDPTLPCLPPKAPSGAKPLPAPEGAGFSGVLFRLSDGENALWITASESSLPKIMRAGTPSPTDREIGSPFDRSWRLPLLFKEAGGDSRADKTTRGALRWAARVGNKAWSRAPKKTFESTPAINRRWQVEGEGAAAWAQECADALLVNVELPRYLEIDEAARWGLAKWEIGLFTRIASGSFDRRTLAEDDGVFAWAQKAFSQLGSTVALGATPCVSALTGPESMIQEFPPIWAQHERELLATASVRPVASENACDNATALIAKNKKIMRI